MTIPILSEVYVFFSDRPIKGANRKFKHIPNTQCLPEPPFEISLSDFPKLQHADSSDLLDLQKQAWGPVGSAEGDQLPLKPRERLENSALITKEVSLYILCENSRILQDSILICIHMSDKFRNCYV